MNGFGRHKNKKLIKGLLILLTALITVASILPILFIVANSLMDEAEIQERYRMTELNNQSLEQISSLSKPAEGTTETGDKTHEKIYTNIKATLWPGKATLKQFSKILFSEPVYIRLIWNSILLAVPILLMQLIIAPAAAYGFERLQWKHKEILFLVYVVVMLMPLQLLLVPHFLIAKWLNFSGWEAIAFPAAFQPFCVFILRQFIKLIPQECLEAGAMDGANEWILFYKIMLPAMRPAVISMIILQFAEQWNMVDQAIVFIQDPYKMPLSLYLGRIVDDNLAVFFAVAVFYLFPALLVLLLGKNELLMGISLTKNIGKGYKNS